MVMVVVIIATEVAEILVVIIMTSKSDGGRGNVDDWSVYGCCIADGGNIIVNIY